MTLFLTLLKISHFLSVFLAFFCTFLLKIHFFDPFWGGPPRSWPTLGHFFNFSKNSHFWPIFDPFWGHFDPFLAQKCLFFALQNRSEWPILANFRQKMAKNGHFWRFFANFYDFLPFFGPFCRSWPTLAVFQKGVKKGSKRAQKGPKMAPKGPFFGKNGVFLLKNQFSKISFFCKNHDFY